MSPEVEAAEEQAYQMRQSGTALSWRDVGRMVAESETRLQRSIDRWGEQVKCVLDDHEDRLNTEEKFTVGVKASGNTAERFFSFGKYILATFISICGVAIAAMAFAASHLEVVK